MPHCEINHCLLGNVLSNVANFCTKMDTFANKLRLSRFFVNDMSKNVTYATEKLLIFQKFATPKFQPNGLAVPEKAVFMLNERHSF